jgi:histidyl-tRNA synthetase
MNFNAPRGTHDLIEKDAENLRYLETLCRKIFEKWNYSEICFPTFEDAGLFTRSIGESTDIIEKEMYVFEDRKGRKLALRPEGTASTVRALLEHSLMQKMPAAKLFYMGPMFRYERPQAGRYREFYQAGAEYFGNSEPPADAEIIIAASEILKSAGLKKIDTRLNSLGCKACRPAFRQELKNYFSSKEGLCEDCSNRLEKNPLRVLDCKIDGPRFTDLPQMEKFLCPECKKHFDGVKELLEKSGCGYTVDHKLVRGLDYYTKTIFEIRGSAEGAQDALCAGGRYDNLVEELGGSPTPAVGFALGSERVIAAAQKENAVWNASRPLKVFVAVSGESLLKEAFVFAAGLRRSNLAEPVKLAICAGAPEICVEGPVASRSLKSQLKLADKFGADKTIIFGEDEYKRGAVVLRDMKTQEQKEIKIV